MALLVECPACHRAQGTKNKLCSCGQDLDKAKRSKRARYWISYRLPGGKQRREVVGSSLEEARAAEGKRRAQKRERPHILEKLAEERMTFGELATWYLDLRAVKKLRTYDRVQGCLANFNGTFGDQIVGRVKPMDLEDYQERRQDKGAAPATIDMELVYARAMVSKAFDNDLVSGHTLKAFRRCKRKLTKGSNVRVRTLSAEEYTRLVAAAPRHLRGVLVLAYHTGMRKGELRALRWSHVDHDKGFIRLPATLTKEGRGKSIPMNHHVRAVLDALPRAIHPDFVFAYKGAPLRREAGLKSSFETACKRARIPYGRNKVDGITFHDIRRTVKTNMLDAGVDSVYRDLILGHSLGGMDAHYMAPTEEKLRRAMARFTQWLDRQLESVEHSVEQEEL